jgi:ribosomal protein S18 acetylase RimI-like enzyme
MDSHFLPHKIPINKNSLFFEKRTISTNTLIVPLPLNSSGKGMSMGRVEYITADEHSLDKIRHLWEQLNEHHYERASHFQNHYEQMTFEDRKAYFTAITSTGTIHLDLARDSVTDRFVGYCVSSVSSDNNGEIESIFVEPDYRSNHIGSDLICRALDRMDASGVQRKRVSVGEGNEEAWEFYRKFGFYPRMTILEQKK